MQVEERIKSIEREAAMLLATGCLVNELWVDDDNGFRWTLVRFTSEEIERFVAAVKRFRDGQGQGQFFQEGEGDLEGLCCSFTTRHTVICVP